MTKVVVRDRPVRSLGEGLALALMVKLLETIEQSGANQTEAECAIDGARALLRELNLGAKPFAVHQT
jgi:hypothetical protein